MAETYGFLARHIGRRVHCALDAVYTHAVASSDGDPLGERIAATSEALSLAYFRREGHSATSLNGLLLARDVVTQEHGPVTEVFVRVAAFRADGLLVGDDEVHA